MLKVHTITWGMLGENCYLCYDDQSPACFVVDPGCHAERIWEAAADLHKTVEAVVLTHGHFDHMVGAKALAAENIPVYMNEKDRDMPRNLAKDLMPDTTPYGQGDVLNLGGLAVQVLETPGHSKGSVSLLCRDVLFSGDTLFQGACGRTDFYGGSPEDMTRSLQRLMALPEHIRVYPGHGEATCIGAEKLHNPYCR